VANITTFFAKKNNLTAASMLDVFVVPLALFTRQLAML